jgi:sortase (surface protein transpeptidase)
MVVESVGLDAPIELGAIVDGAMQDPTGPWVVSWYEPLGKVGEGGNVVMSGHLDYWNTGPDGTAGPAIFYEVPNMAPGEVIRLVGENGEDYEYAVEWTRQFDVATELTPEVIQTEIVGDTGQESLTLITCGGDFDAATGEYLKRWVLRANRI